MTHQHPLERQPQRQNQDLDIYGGIEAGILTIGIGSSSSDSIGLCLNWATPSPLSAGVC